MAALMLTLACSVYEVPSGPGGPTAGAEAGGGQGSDTTAGSGSDGGIATAGAGGTARSGGNGGTSVGGGGGGVGSGGLPSAGTAGSVPSVPAGGEGGAPAVVDDCLADPNKLEPGECGCGVPEAPSTTGADCVTLEALLSHRYDFEGSGTVVRDRVGTAHGTIARGATLSKLDGKGVVLLGGGAGGAYVDLPNGLISSLENATIEAWVTWGGGSQWQRIFDFGDSTNSTPEDNPGSGKSYLFLTPSSASGGPFLAYSLAGNTADAEVRVQGKAPMAQSLSHVAVVTDDAGNKLSLYVDGALAAEHVWAGSLAAINDVNVWLGRSQFSGDPELGAVFHEFRIYQAALTAAQVAASFNAGPDPAFLSR